MLNKKLKKLLSVAVVITSLLLTVGTAHAVNELDLASCLDAGGGASWMSCPMIDTVQRTVNGIFVNVLQDWLEVEPELFTHLDPNSPGSSVFSAWQYFQGIANIGLVIYLFIILLSQFTGVGISNYGIKKALPRVLLCAVLVNLSYIICQVVVDVSNIAGGGVRALFDGLIKDSALVARGTQDTGITVAVIAVVVGLLGIVIVLMRISPIFIIPVMMGAITLLLAVVFLFLVLGIRQVLAVLLVVVSPIAIICYSVPGLKGIFNKWLGILKAVLLAYPLAAFMIGGGSLAAQILYQVWDGDNHFFAALGSMLICVVPYFFIPSLLKSSIGKLANFADRARNGIGNFANRKLQNSDIAKSLKYRTDRNRAYRWSGLRTDGHGNLRRNADGTLRRRRSGSNRSVDVALRFAADEREIENMRANPTLMQDRENRMLEQEAAGRIRLRGELPQALRDRLTQAQTALNEAAGNNDTQQMRLQEAEIRALTKTLAGSSGGRKELRSFLQNSSFGGANPPLSDNMKHIMGSSLTMDELDKVSRSDPRLARALGQWGNTNTGPLADFNTPAMRTYTADMISNFSDQDFAQLDGDVMKEMLEQSIQNVGGGIGPMDPNALANGNYEIRNDAFAQAFADHCVRTGDNKDLMGKASAQKGDIIRSVSQKRRPGP